MPHSRNTCLLTLLWVALLATACRPTPSVPEPGTDAYQETITAFYTGLAALQAGEDRGARALLERVTEQAPGEPAAWANLGLLALRRNDLEAARRYLNQAARLAPENPRIHVLQARLALAEDQPEQARSHLLQALRTDPSDLEAAYLLFQLLETHPMPDDTLTADTLLARMLHYHPDNQALWLERLHRAVATQNARMLRETVTHLQSLVSTWPEEARVVWQELQALIRPPDWTALTTQVRFLRNTLLQHPAFRTDLAELQPPPDVLSPPLSNPLRLKRPQATFALPDTLMTFQPEPLSTASVQALRVVWKAADASPSLLLVRARDVQFHDGAVLNRPGPTPPTVSPRNSLALFDFDNDFRMDIALLGRQGLRLYRQHADGAFTTIELPDLPAVTLTGLWVADFDLEGDLDLLVGTRSGIFWVGNNGDQTFQIQRVFSTAPHQLVWSDLDSDGDPDLAVLDLNGTLHLWRNERQGLFLPDTTLPSTTSCTITTADLDHNGRLELILWRPDGTLQQLAYAPHTRSWHISSLPSRTPTLPESTCRQAHLFTADLDNNGAQDLIASVPAQTWIWLVNARGNLRPEPLSLNAQTFDAADLNGDGRLDLAAVQPDGTPIRLLNQSDAPYGWTQLHPQAVVVGDQRVNSFGIGGIVEIRAGTIYQKQVIQAPVVHFGLGLETRVPLARIVWPNGNVQAEFNLAANQTVQATQRLKGSCPWVFTFNGERMVFVTDFIWGSPLGLRINAQETGDIAQTEDWIKIRGDQLRPRNGFYDVRITAELWETHFFDHISLMAVDHPEGTEIWVDERFAFPPRLLKLYTTGPVQPIARATNHTGRDVTAMVQQRDGHYFDAFALGAYQGIAEPHFIEVDLGKEVPADQPLYLIAYGWLRPTDSSINVAISQGRHPRPRGLRVEVPDGQGGWRVAYPDLGFPAGRLKTIVIDLTNQFPKGGPYRVRLHTNLEIYWDWIGWAEGRPALSLRTHRLQPAVAELRYRGYSATVQPFHAAPEIPLYDSLASTAQRWRDLEGYYTRFGDVRELLARVDDRYVIMNAGDELVLRFQALPDPPEGWVRDFVLIGDGWVKDGDFNTTFSRTVRPLPYHGQPGYDTPPGRLWDDPVYQRFPEDWLHFHTRYVAPDRFDQQLTLPLK
ncbi:CRTAC1 family protein [Rhodothermus profundi]|uniref:Repeat domain-containing protein n=1 Tax=Rhodothermus profundi TaxID=633813 RepID=A0A1M6SW99_9BACT|nr:CRTAC1 family protein [Rhodothermus profundi]SHK48939.1 Repeat domain-containing protein [Rhodothermus profundi]